MDNNHKKLEKNEEGEVVALETILKKIDVNSRPVKLARIQKDRMKFNDTCWGCIKSFGSDDADPLTKKLHNVFRDNMFIMDEKMLFARISNDQVEQFVKNDPKNETRWTVQSIEEHVKKHMTCGIYKQVVQVRNLDAVIDVCGDFVFREDETTGELIDFDPKRLDSYVRAQKTYSELVQKLPNSGV